MIDRPPSRRAAGAALSALRWIAKSRLFTPSRYRWAVVFPDWDCAQGAGRILQAGLGFGMLVVCRTDGDRATCAARTLFRGILRVWDLSAWPSLRSVELRGLAGFRPPWISLGGWKFSRFSRQEKLFDTDSRRCVNETARLTLRQQLHSKTLAYFLLGIPGIRAVLRPGGRARDAWTLPGRLQGPEQMVWCWDGRILRSRRRNWFSD